MSTRNNVCCFCMLVGTWRLAFATVRGKRQSAFQDQPSMKRLDVRLAIALSR